MDKAKVIEKFNTERVNNVEKIDTLHAEIAQLNRDYNHDCRTLSMVSVKPDIEVGEKLSRESFLAFSVIIITQALLYFIFRT